MHLSEEEQEAFWSQVQKNPTPTCWPWAGKIDGAGFGVFMLRGAPTKAHRIALKLTYPTWPASSTDRVHHTCHFHMCVNPAHLYSDSTRKTHCSQDHPLSGTNLYTTPQGVRRCRECMRAQSREHYHRNH